MTNRFYLDMDGVVADWASACVVYLGQSSMEFLSQGYYHTSPDEWIRIRQQQRFYRDLPLMPLVDQLVDLARQYRDTLGWELLFLTAVPRHDDMPWAFYDKVNWAREYFPDIPVHFGPYSSQKHRHCRPGDILVDDRYSNCQEWESAGGLSFHVKFNNLEPIIDMIHQDLALRVSQRNLRDITLDLI